LLGASYQAGLIPLNRDSIIQAIELNKSGAEQNLVAFEIGRMFVYDSSNKIFHSINSDKKNLISINDLKSEIKNYSKYTFKEFLKIEKKIKGKSLEKELIDESLREYGRICLVKDEYQVAKMHIKNYRKIINSDFDSWNKLSFYLAPPFLSFLKDPKTGRPRKFQVPGWLALPLFYFLDKLSIFRNTPLDLFRFSKERKIDLEHKKIYEQRLEDILKNKKPSSELNKLNKISQKVKGYGPVKESNFQIFKQDIIKRNINISNI
jgi:indolepyruvate ferredoxin oxidoreductase